MNAHTQTQSLENASANLCYAVKKASQSHFYVQKGMIIVHQHTSPLLQKHTNRQMKQTSGIWDYVRGNV